MAKPDEEYASEAGGLSPSQMLREDHRKVQEYFDAFEGAQSEDEKQRIADGAVRELKIHTAIEEEIFYPALRRVLEDTDLLDEAAEEHHVAKLLIDEIESLRAGQDHFDAKFKVLAESVRHHIREEESEMLPQAEQAGIEDIAEEMAERKRELQEEYEEGKPRKSRRRARRAPAARRQRSKR